MGTAVGASGPADKEVAVKQIPVSSLVPGMVVELTGWQKLWDIAVTPWREYSPPARFHIMQVTPMLTGASHMTPYTVILRAPDGARIELEVADGQESVAIVQSP